jgi:hypothetical protein
MEPMRRRLSFNFLVLLALAASPLACGDDDAENTGEACAVPDDCYEDVLEEDRDMIAGEIECLENVEGGYCTHQCETDDDCCTVLGECLDEEEHPQVCSPFENESGIKRCFLSCEPEVIGDLEENEFCQEFADEDFGCRSSGGGDENRKVCVPPG